MSPFLAPDDQFKTVRISLFSRDLYFTINQILRSCGMYDELKRNNSTKDTYTNADIPSPYGGPLDWLQVYRKFGDRTSNHERDFQNKTEVTLKSFLRDEMEKAKERLEQSEKSYEEAMSLSRQICTELGLVNLTLDCGWSCASCQGSLKNLLQLCKEKKADMLSLDRRSVVLTRWTGVDPRGNVMLGVEDVPQFWLAVSLFIQFRNVFLEVKKVFLVFSCTRAIV